MKKIFLFTFMVMASCALYAQTFGLKGGLNVATVDNNQGSNIESRLSYHAGGLVNIPISPQLAVQPEVVYSSQGAKYVVGNNEQHNLTLNYVNIPVMLQAYVGRGFYAQVGPQLGILTGVADKVNDIETGIFTKQDFKSNDVSVGFGVGYKGLSGFGVDARYNLGLTNINNTGSANIKNNVIQVGLMLSFGGLR
jgi:hypothetical protein